MPASRVSPDSPWHIVFVLDDDACLSLPGDIFHKAIIESFRDVLSKHVTECFRFSLVRFGSEARMVLEAGSPFGFESSFVKSTPLIAPGNSSAADDALRRTIEILRNHPGAPSDFTPYIFFFSNGRQMNAVTTTSAANELKSLNIAAGKPTLITISLSKEANHELMTLIASNPELYVRITNAGRLFEVMASFFEVVDEQLIKVFISYRRADSAGYAGRVYDHLAKEFSANLLFMDVDDIPPGSNFVEKLNEEVNKCDVLLAVIGSNWLEAKDEHGRRRIDDPSDFVRVEIGAALRRDIPVIPILIDGTRVPRAEQLPTELKGLAQRNCFDIRHASFRRDLDGLAHHLRSLGRRSN